MSQTAAEAWAKDNNNGQPTGLDCDEHEDEEHFQTGHEEDEEDYDHVNGQRPAKTATTLPGTCPARGENGRPFAPATALVPFASCLFSAPP